MCLLEHCFLSQSLPTEGESLLGEETVDPEEGVVRTLRPYILDLDPNLHSLCHATEQALRWVYLHKSLYFFFVGEHFEC